ncbi:MAG: acetyl-CoA carboxylase carboxyltransferase subunit alpha [Verrucomicrobiota bacterium]
MNQPDKKEIAPLEFEKPIMELEKKIREMEAHSTQHDLAIEKEMISLRKKLESMSQEIYGNLTPWQRVQIVRHPKRPFLMDYIDRIATDFVEIAGDRLFSNDKAMVTGFATIDGHRVVVVGHQKGRDTKENIKRNFGMAHAEGYRKALRAMKLADKFGLPVVTFIDTPGAYPGVGAEERHIGEAIAVNIREMFQLTVPVLGLVIGEGGSGGALGIGVTDRILILENAYYSVISPEGCAAILWKDRAHAPKAAAALKMTSGDLKQLALVDEIIPEPMGGAQYDWAQAATAVKSAIVKNLLELKKLSNEKLLNQRYARYRKFGEFTE